MKNETKGKLFILGGASLCLIPTFFISWVLGLMFTVLLASFSLVAYGMEIYDRKDRKNE